MGQSKRVQSCWYLTCEILLGLTLIKAFAFCNVGAYDPLDPNGNITVKWDVLSWIADGYVAVLTINNFQQYRHIEPPGWTLGWTWAEREVIWSMFGARATEKGNCSRFHGDIPQSCTKSPTIVDLLPGTPLNQQTAKCCKGGVIASWVQDPPNSVSSFQITVGSAGTTNSTVRLPKNFTLRAPGPGYTCGPSKRVRSSLFLTKDGHRVTQALMTWQVICSYSQFLAHKAPTCCVSLSSFYNDTKVPCPVCSCGCHNYTTQGDICVKKVSPLLKTHVCTAHMCPIMIDWQVQSNYRDYWEVKITITNFNNRMNYSQWNIVVQHPNFGNLTQVFGFNFKLLSSHGKINDTALLWGIKNYNDMLNQGGTLGNVQSELLFRKDNHIYSSNSIRRWAFPSRIYFNGDDCVLPPSDAYPWVPN